MAEQWANRADTILAAAVAAGDTVLAVTSAASFPALPEFRVLVDDELMLVTAGAGGTSWTVTRGIEGTASAPHELGASVHHIITAGSLAALRDTVGTGGLPAVGAEGDVLTTIAGAWAAAAPAAGGASLGPVLRLSRLTTFSLNSTSSVVVPWDDELEDPADMFDPANPTDIIIPQSGLWQFSYRLASTPGNTGTRQFAAALNGGDSIFVHEHVANSIGSGAVAGTFPLRLSAGDVLIVRARNTAAAGVLLKAAYSPFVELIRLGD